MNVLLLWAVLCSRPGPRVPHFLWLPVIALATFSAQMQVVTVTGVGDARLIRWLNLGALGVVLSVPRLRAILSARCRSSWATLRAGWPGAASWPAGPWGTALAGGIGGVAVAVIGRALLYLPESADPYHLMKVLHLERSQRLDYVPAADSKLNALSSLYELFLFDLKTTPLAGEALLRMHGVWLLLLYCGLVIDVARRHDRRPDAAVLWGTLFAVPAVFHQFVLVKNDFLSLVLVFLALGWLSPFAPVLEAAGLVRVGALAGLAIAVKATNFPLVVVAALFARTGDGLGASRRLALLAVGVLAGLLAGGFLFTLSQNYAWYGSAFGPPAGSGNLNTEVGQAAVSVGRLSLSLFDLGLVTQRIWPGRGGWGSTMGAVLAAALLILAVTGVRRAAPRRAAAMGLVSLALFGAVYPDADLAHRMALGPGAFLIAAAITVAGSEGGRPWMSRLLLVAAIFGFAQIAGNAVAYLTQIEYLASPRLAAAVEPLLRRPLAVRPVWRMREVNASARSHGLVANHVQENAFLLRGLDYVQVVVAGRLEDEYALRWRIPELRAADFVILGPNDYPESEQALAVVNECLAPGSRLSTLVGPTVPLMGVSCPGRRGAR